MERENYKIDDLFQDGLYNNTTAPPDQVWSDISNQLDNVTLKKKLVLYKRLLAAASIAILIGAGSMIFILNNDTNTLANNTPQETSPFTQPNEKTVTNTAQPANTAEITGSSDDNSMNPVIQANITNTNNPGKTNPTVLTNNNLPDHNKPINQPLALNNEKTNKEKNPSIPFEDIENELATTVIESPDNEKPSANNVNDNELLYSSNELNPLEESLLYGNEEPSPTKKTGKWSIGSHAAPVYSYRVLEANEESASIGEFYDKIEDGLIAYSGGVNVEYNTNGRFSVKSGVYYSKIGQTIQNTYKLKKNIPLESISQFDVKVQNSTGVIQFQDMANDIENRNAAIQQENIQEFTGINSPDLKDVDYFTQSFEFIEVPLIVGYKIIDRKVGVNIQGGFGTSLMVSNNLSFNSGNSEGNIGTVDEVNKINYSSMMGMEIDYKVTRKISVSFEPMFKYYVSKINQSEDIAIHPYSFGMLTGISYTF